MGADSPRYQLGDADFGKQLKVRVSFTDQFNNAESVTSVPFGPIVRPPPLPSPSTLVGNTGQSPSAAAPITSTYAMGFRLGTHGQGYEISSVAIDLAAAPSSLSVSLWTGGPPGSGYEGMRTAKLFEFENPASFQAGLNEFTAPAGVYAYQHLDHWIVLSGFGSSLSINETTSDAEDAGGEPGATLDDDAGGDSSVLRLAVKGSQRDSGILAANFAQPGGNQEIISVGDKIAWGIDLGAADRYLIRGLTLNGDDTTSGDGGFDNPFYFRSDSTSGARHFNLFQTRNVNGLPVWTAPQGATVAGRNTYVFDWQFRDDIKNGADTIDRIGAILHRVQQVDDAADGQSDTPAAPGVSLHVGESISGVDQAGPTAYMAVHGEPLYAVVQNLGRADNGYTSAGTINTVVSQGFTTGALEDGYPLLGFGVNIEDSPSHFPESSASVAVALHADSGGKPGAKLFDLLSPTEYGAGHNFFEAPRGTVLDPETSYVLVWRHVSGISQRLQKTASNGEDPGAYAGFSMADAFHRGADLNNLAEDPDGNALEIAVYARVGNQPATGRPEVYPSRGRRRHPAGRPLRHRGPQRGPGLQPLRFGIRQVLRLVLPVDPGRRRDRGRDRGGRRLGQVPAGGRRYRPPGQGAGVVHRPGRLPGGGDQPALRPHRRSGPVAGPDDPGQQHGPGVVGHGEYHPAVRPGLPAGRSRPGLRDLQRLAGAGRGPVRSDRLPVDRRPSGAR